MSLRTWVRMPSQWIDDMSLRELKWNRNTGSANVAALMVFTALVQQADEATGKVHLPYDQLQLATTLSRSMVSKALAILEKMKLIVRSQDQRSSYVLADYNAPEIGGGAKLPAKRMYSPSGSISFFQAFRLRNRVELDALKLYFLFVGRRGTDTNAANISYEKIVLYSGVEKNAIRTAISFLIEHLMIQTEQQPSSSNEHAIANAYRISGIEPRRHAGTTGRRSL